MKYRREIPRCRLSAVQVERSSPQNDKRDFMFARMTAAGRHGGTQGDTEERFRTQSVHVTHRKSHTGNY